MKFNKSLAALAAAAALLAAPLASQAALQIKISDGVLGDLIITDEVAGDELFGTPGAVSYTGGYGSWTVSLGIGTNAGDPFAMHLTSAVVSMGAVANPLTIEITQTGLSFGSPGEVQAYADGGGAGDGLASWASYIDENNVAFGTSQLIYGKSGYATGGGSGSATVTGLYSATIRTIYDFSGLSPTLHQASLDLDFDVPEPGSIALVGLALVGLGMARRRKA